MPQNAAVQRVAPNAMRGLVTAIYLFMFTFFGAMGAFFSDWDQTEQYPEQRIECHYDLPPACGMHERSASITA